MMKRLLVLLLALALGAPAFASAAPRARLLAVNVDHGTTLTFSAPAASVFIANPDIADVQVMSPTSVLVFGKRVGETTFLASDASGTTLEQRTVSVTQDLSDLRRELEAAIPGNKIRAAALPNGIVLTGDAKDPASVADAYKLAQRYLGAGGDIINRIRVSGSNQIQIRVRFAEVARSVDSSLGFNWQNLGTVSGFAFGVATGVSGLTTGNSILNTRPNNTALSLPNNVIGLSHAGGHFNVNALIDALAQDGLITILAEPNLTAMSGETANFLAGGEFPIPIPQGNGTISIQFKNYGISLAFTPTLIGDQRISLHVKPEVSELTSAGSIILNNISVPALTTRRAETTVEVASGQSFAIAGLIDNKQSQTVNKYPLLGDLPILGSLFRSDRFQNGQTELVIIITPYIVRPSGEQLALPTDGFSPPSEADRLLDLRYSASNPSARPVSGSPTALPADAPGANPAAVPSAAYEPAASSPEHSPASVPLSDAVSTFPSVDAANQNTSLPATLPVPAAVPEMPGNDRAAADQGIGVAQGTNVTNLALVPLQSSPGSKSGVAARPRPSPRTAIVHVVPADSTPAGAAGFLLE